MKKFEMTSNKPYLLRAFYEWISDNQMVPHIVVNATVKNVKVPTQYVEDGRIVLNISYSATQHLQITNEVITFSARFSGKAMNLYIPIEAVYAIYARETGAGMVFDEEIVSGDQTGTETTDTTSGSDTSDTHSPASGPSKNAGKPKLTIVK